MKRYCRICYNTNGWCEPSGDAAKLEVGETFAVINGFGHEEWLFDTTTLMSSPDETDKVYKYGFLQPIGKYRNAYVGKFHEVFLYAVSPQREKISIGRIHNLYVPHDEELDYAYQQAGTTGLLASMAEQAAKFKTENSDVNFFDAYPFHVFNVRYRPADLEIFEPFSLISSGSPVYKSNRYHPLKYSEGDIPFRSHEAVIGIGQAVPHSANDKERSEAVRRKCAVMGTSYSPQHVILQNKIYRFLCAVYGKANVYYEKGYVDLTVASNGSVSFFEIKIKATARNCIREAFGQLIEYCHYPNDKKSNRLIVVGDKAPTDFDIEYLKYVREKYGICLYYQYWNDAISELSDEH